MKKDKKTMCEVTLKHPIKKPGSPMEAKEQVIDDMRTGIIGVEDLTAKEVSK